MSPVRILFVRSCRGITNITGGETYLLALMEGLNPQKYKSFLFCITNPRIGKTPWLNEIDTRGLPHVKVEVGNLMSIKDLIILLKWIRRFQPDIIHSLDHRSDFTAVAAGKIERKPVVASTLGWVNFTPGSFRDIIYPWLDRKALTLTDAVLTDSVAFAKQLNLGIHAPPIVPIPNGVDTRKFDPDRIRSTFKKRFFNDEGVLVIGMVGRIHPVKAQVDFLRAAVNLARDYTNVRFLIIGPVPAGFKSYYRELKGIITKNELDKKVVMSEVHSGEIPTVFSTIDILLAPSLAESFPFSLLEAMAMRKAIIASDVGGNSEMINQGENGLLIKAGDWKALLRDAKTLIDNPDFRKRLGRAARQKIIKELSNDVMAMRVGCVYDAIMNKAMKGRNLPSVKKSLRNSLMQIAENANPGYNKNV